MDVRPVLTTVRAPTLVVHRTGSPLVPIEQARYLADPLPDGRLMLSEGDEPSPWSEPVDQIIDEVEAFVAGARNRPLSTDRVLATVLFTDIVGSTERAAAMGDRRWTTVLGPLVRRKPAHRMPSEDGTRQCGVRVCRVGRR